MVHGKGTRERLINLGYDVGACEDCKCDEDGSYVVYNRAEQFRVQRGLS